MPNTLTTSLPDYGRYYSDLNYNLDRVMDRLGFQMRHETLTYEQKIMCMVCLSKYDLMHVRGPMDGRAVGHLLIDRLDEVRNSMDEQFEKRKKEVIGLLL
jgi:hypothetical protein